jgi:hypothetical protein
MGLLSRWKLSTPSPSLYLSLSMSLPCVQDEVPILRNRQRKFLLIESPWDDFGPTPPPGVDYNYSVDDSLLAPR